MSEKLGTDKLRERVHAKYGGYGWIVFDEFRDATGFASHCAADVVALGMYASRGFELHGVEIKTSRSDWLSDLNTPDKNDVIASSVDFWWIAADVEVVKADELPQGWGLYLPSGTGLRASVRAKRRNTDRAFPRPLVASLIQRAVKFKGPGKIELAAQYEKGRLDGERNAQMTRKWELDSAQKRASACELALAAFEKESGLKISQWDAGDVGKVVADLCGARDAMQLRGLHADIKRAAITAQIALETLVRARAGIEEYMAAHATTDDQPKEE